ncbi:MAG: hypothetical protein RID53_14545 [Coleofasciculus sp. B1-GNL1-01]|uniref:hypothetical protein n=1 Tax=Coleofasciculus sp. B1-GNL1-01 TaxID=3068484 RepID=UPI0032FE2EC3
MKPTAFYSSLLISSSLAISSCTTTTQPIEQEFMINTPLGEHVAINGTKIEVEIDANGNVECEVEMPDGQEYEQTFNLNDQVASSHIVYNGYVFECEREEEELEIDIQRVGQDNSEFWEQSITISQFLSPGYGVESDDDNDDDD